MENMGMNAGGPDSEVKNLLLQGFRAAKENRREEAYQLFCDVVARDPNNEYGWLYRAATTDSRSEAYVCLEKVLSINPNNTKAQRGLERIREQQQEESDGEGESDSGQTYAAVPPEPAQGRIGSNEYVSDYDQTGPQRGVYETQAPSQSSSYPFPVEEAQPSSYPGYGNESAYSSFDRPTVPPPPPTSDNYGGFNSMDTQPRPGYDNYYANQAENAAPAMPSYEEDAQDSAQAATRQRLRGGKKAGAGFGAEAATDLDDTGRQRQRRTRSGLLIPLILLLLIAALVVGVLYLMGRNNNTGTDQAALDAANATSTAAAVTTGTATVAGGAGVTTAASGTGATTVAGGTGATTAAGGTGATTAANATTAAAGTGATTAAGGTNTTPPAATTAAPANTTPPPANTTAAPATTAPPASTTAASGGNTGGTAVSTRPVLYTVVAGDNLTKISRQFGTSPDAIRAANRYTQPITGDAIFGGNRYIIPVSRPDFRGSGHIVAQGDTLDSIAAKYNTTADAIVKLNGLSSPSDIKPGDPLLIP